ncbi:MAG: hypothetical protein ABI036_03470 [Fibrobacteria bacterium]
MSILDYAPRALLCFLCSIAPVCARAPVIAFEATGPALTVKHPAMYPETIEYDAREDRFLLGSFREGAIYGVDQSGKASLLVEDPRLCSVLGIAVDAGRSRLWAVNSDLGASARPSAAGPKNLAGVGVYDLVTGKAIRYVDLATLVVGPHLLNGIALDSAGNAYVTDSFSPVIYKVAPTGEAGLFLRDERFSGSGVNLNGLVVHPDGYLLVIKKSEGSLFKVPLSRPSEVSQVTIDRSLVGGDGLTLAGGRDLVVIANRTPEKNSDAAFSLSTRDGWASAKVVAVQDLGDVYPTTGVVRKGVLYVVHSKLNQLISAPPDEKARLRELAVIRPIGRVAP